METIKNTILSIEKEIKDLEEKQLKNKVGDAVKNLPNLNIKKNGFSLSSIEESTSKIFNALGSAKNSAIETIEFQSFCKNILSRIDEISKAIEKIEKFQNSKYVEKFYTAELAKGIESVKNNINENLISIKKELEEKKEKTALT